MFDHILLCRQSNKHTFGITPITTQNYTQEEGYVLLAYLHKCPSIAFCERKCSSHTHTHTHWECLVAFIPQLALNKLCAERWHTHSEVIMSEETVLLPKLFPQSEWTSVHKYSFLQAGYKSLVIYSNQKLYFVIQGTARLYEIISPCNKPHWHGTILFWSGFIWLLRNTFKKQLWLECTKWPWISWLFMTRSLSKNIRWSFNDMKSLVEVFIFQME